MANVEQINETLSQNKKGKEAWGYKPLVAFLPSLCETLILIHSTIRKDEVNRR